MQHVPSPVLAGAALLVGLAVALAPSRSVADPAAQVPPAPVMQRQTAAPETAAPPAGPAPVATCRTGESYDPTIPACVATQLPGERIGRAYGP